MNRRFPIWVAILLLAPLLVLPASSPGQREGGSPPIDTSVREIAGNLQVRALERGLWLVESTSEWNGQTISANGLFLVGNSGVLVIDTPWTEEQTKLLASSRPQSTRAAGVTIESAAAMQFVLLPPGEFSMGSPEDVIGREPQEVLHPVRITRAFHMGRTEVTQAQWVKIMGTNPSLFSDCDNCPVENVSWFDVQEFIARLNDETGESFRLPTEAEWEYACRAGATTPFHTGGNLTTDQANYDGRYPYPGQARGVYRERTTEVASFEPNPWGLYDMHGNVWEWCRDRHCSYPEGGEVDDPLGDCDSQLRVIRGGSWYFNADSARCGLRYTHRPQDVGPSLGFRLVRETSAR